MSQEESSRGSSSEDNAIETFSIPTPPHQNRKNPANDLERKLLGCLAKKHDSILAIDLARLVGMKAKKAINPTLYGMEKKGWVRKVLATPPKWVILPEGRNALSGSGTLGGQPAREHFAQRKGGRGGGNSRQKRGREPAAGGQRGRHDWLGGSSNVGPERNQMMSSSGFRDGSKWIPDEHYQEKQPKIQQGLEVNVTSGERNVYLGPPSNDVQHVSDLGQEELTFDTSPEPMDVMPSIKCESIGSSIEPWKMHGFGRGIIKSARGDPIPPRKPTTDSQFCKINYNSSDPESFIDTKETSEGGNPQLPTFPHQMLVNSNQRTLQPETPFNPGMGRGMGRLIQSEAQRHGSFGQSLTQVKFDSSTDVTGENLEKKILQELSSGKKFSTVDLARAISGKQAASRDINPTLYKLMRLGQVQKVQAQPPLWCSSMKTGKTTHSNQVTTFNSEKLQSQMPPAPHLLLPAGNQDKRTYQGPVQTSSVHQMPPSLDPARAPPPLANIGEMMKMMNKNPISAFIEFGQSVQQQPVLEMVGQTGPSHKPKFTFIARVGRRKFPPVVTQNKKDGRREAAEAALRILGAEGAFQMSSIVSKNSEPGYGGSTFFDHIATLAHQTFNNLAVDVPECSSGKKVIAALIMQTSSNDNGRVIALGTGNRCVTGDKLSLEGQSVHDSHAEVVTRRAFMRYLYRQLKIYRTNPEKTILTPSPSGKLTTREGSTFHLYISTAPCGDGAQFSWTDNQGNEEGPKDDLNFAGHAHHCPTQEKNIQGLLRTKMELGEGTIPIQEKNPIQTWDAILQNQQRLRTMSCSDKVCRWNILGLQGSLLSNFVEPIYLSSLTLGALYHHGHLARAVCCRMDHYLNSIGDVVDALPPGYRINHPQLGHVTSPDPPRGTEKTKEFSMNWFAGCDNAEVTDGTVGRIKGVVPSRLCKMNLLKEFMEVSALYNMSLPEDADTYIQIKQMAEDFHKAKKFMKHIFRKGKAGTWVEKPIEVGMFPP